MLDGEPDLLAAARVQAPLHPRDVAEVLPWDQ